LAGKISHRFVFILRRGEEAEVGSDGRDDPQLGLFIGRRITSIVVVLL
jgi:hypothetical protein